MKQSLKRLLSMILALFFVVAALVVFFDLVQPSYGGMESLRAQLIGQTASLNSEKTIVTQAENLINSYQNQSSGQANVELAVPQGEDIAGALAQMEGIAENDNVSITSVAIGNPVINVSKAASANDAGSAAQAVKPLGSFTLGLVGLASYEDLKNFLSQIETNIRIFDVQSLSMSPVPVVAVLPVGGASGKNASSTAPVSHDLFNYNVVIKTYYQLP